MSKICQITGKKPVVGNFVSHSNKKTKRNFYINLFKKRFYFSKEKQWIRLKVSAAAIKIINSIGIKKAIQRITIININNGKKSKNK